MNTQTARSKVFAEQFSDPKVAVALREHRADRDALLASWITSLRSDPRVRASWLWGSFGRNEADDLSDLDLWLIVADEEVGRIGESVRLYAQQTGSFITGGESLQNAPPGGGFFSSRHEGRHGLLHLDCYWQPQSARTAVPEHAVLFDRLQEPLPIPLTRTLPQERALPQEHVALTPEAERIEDGLGFAWLMLSIAAKTLARHPDSDMALAAYARPGLEDAAGLLGLDNFMTPADWSVPDSPQDKIEYLRRLAGKTAQLTEAATARGLSFSRMNAVCLDRYLDMIEGILR